MYPSKQEGLVESVEAQALREKILGSFTNPELIEISTQMMIATNQIGQEIADLAEESPESTEPTVTQDHIDGLIIDMIGVDKYAETSKLSDALWSLTKKSIDKTSPDDTVTPIVDAMSSLVFTGLKSRDYNRRRHGDAMTKSRRLIDFWRNGNTTLTTDQCLRLEDAILKPIRDNLAPVSMDDLGSYTPRQIDQILSRHSEIDPRINLGLTKFLVFSGIVDCLAQPVMREAYHKAIHVGAKATDEVNKSEYGAFYTMARFLTNYLESDDPNSPTVGLLLYYSGHTKGRLLKVPNREFKETYMRAKALVTTYGHIRQVEGLVRGMSTIDSTLNNQRHDLVKNAANNLLADAVDIFDTTTASMMSLLDVDSRKALAEGLPNDSIWHEALRADGLKLGAVSDFLKQIDQLRLDIDPVMKERLQNHSSSPIGEILEQTQLELELERLKPEIDKRLLEFHGIDDLYRLTNKRIRERESHVITLAKHLIDSLPEGQALDETTARTLAGLMKGIYWESTGKSSDDTKLAEKYLKDVGQLRLLSAELEYLGQPQDSSLLKAMNLLDELIDVGLFDKTAAHPELEEFIDFVLAYTIAKDVHSNEDHEDQEEDVTDNASPATLEPVLPIETIRQAVHEDLLVFPPSASTREVISDYIGQISEADKPTIEWERIKKIIELRDHFVKQGLEINFIRTKHASWQVLPFFVLEIKLPNDQHSVAVVESPVYGNATYVFREADDRLGWRDVVQLTRQEARELGAVPAVHVDSNKLDKHFQKLWDRVISELTVLR